MSEESKDILPQDVMDLEEALEEAEITLAARTHYSETESYQAVLKNRYDKFYRYYAPFQGDQWPQDLAERPGMIHVTHNIIEPAVNTESTVESHLPRLTLEPDTMDQDERKRAEAGEKLMKRFLDLSGWDVWINTACRVKAMYGKAPLKVFWNKAQKRPDVSVVENPANLRIGWGTSDYSEIDWALYEYSISPFQAMVRWPDLEITTKGKNKPLQVVRSGKHDDPLDTLSGVRGAQRYSRPVAFQPSDYENRQVRVWDYWTKTTSGEIVNAFFVEGVLADKPASHPELPDIPYIIIEHDHIPGNPEGSGEIEGLIDIQDELNRALSHWAQLIADELDPAFQVDADTVPSGGVPQNGQIIAAGEGKQIRPIEKQVNQFPVQALVAELYKSFHFRTGLPEIMFSLPPGAQTAGRAMQIQIESSANRIGPRRNRLYRGLWDLLVFWSFMIEHVNPKLDVGDGQKAGIADLIRGFRRWRFQAPEITPRDNIENTTNVLNKLNGRVLDQETAIDELGYDSPLEIIEKIRKDRSDPRTFPGDVQGFMAVVAQALDFMLKMQQMGMDPSQLGLQGLPTMGPNTGPQQAQDQAMLPQGIQGDNATTSPQPMTQAGSPPPPGAGGAVENQTLVRAQPSGGVQALQQIRLTNGGQ